MWAYSGREDVTFAAMRQIGEHSQDSRCRHIRTSMAAGDNRNVFNGGLTGSDASLTTAGYI